MIKNSFSAGFITGELLVMCLAYTHQVACLGTVVRACQWRQFGMGMGWEWELSAIVDSSVSLIIGVVLSDVELT